MDATLQHRPAASDDDVSAMYLAGRAGLERYARSLVRDPDEAADVCQEVYLRLLVECRAGRTPENPTAWMHRVAHNLIVSASRRRKTDERTVERLAQPETTIASTEETVIRRERDAALVVALARSSAADRMAMLLAAQGFRAGEIGSRIGRTELATRTLLCRARGRLRTQLVTLDAA